jgi:acyl transferase domain-containing protein
MMLSRMNFLSPDSVCYSFDERANGYARGEGIIVMVLKRLTDALHDGDTIRAVIRSSGTNQDGRTPGLTQPSGSAQEQLIRSVYAKAGLDIASTRYVEAHGKFREYPCRYHFANQD